MKCTICARLTLPGAKLCPACRSALRRARDDTISELLPLPGRVDRLAYRSAGTFSAAMPAPASRKARKPEQAETPKTPPRASRARISSTTIALLGLSAVAMGIAVFGFIGARQSHVARPVERSMGESVVARVAPAGEPRISPASLAEEARQTTTLNEKPDEVEVVTAPAEPALPATLRKEPARTERARAAPRVAPPMPASSVPLGPQEEILPRVAPVVVAAAPPAPPPDRWQLLASGLSRCSGNVFSRLGCEQAIRSKFCEGYWGDVPQCPAGIPNDHGQ